MDDVLNNKKKWDKLSLTWMDAGPPATPSKEDLFNYKTLIWDCIKHNEGNILILGCTPGIREIFLQTEFINSINIICVDFSKKMYDKTTEFLKEKNPYEKFIEANWLDFKLGENKFDAIIGDKIIDNIPPKYWTIFFKNIQLHLKASGGFIVHLAPQNELLKGASFTSLLSKWAINDISTPNSLRSITSGFWEELLGASAYKNGEHNTQKIVRFENEVLAIIEHHQSLNESERKIFNEFIRVFWDSRKDEWSSYSYLGILKRMNKYFKLSKITYSADYKTAPKQPIILLRPKS